MIVALLSLLALQADPQIEKVERIAGDVNRPLLWTPLKITVSSSAGYSGDVVARSGFGFQTARKIVVAPGGRSTLLLPAIDPTEVAVGKTVRKMSRDFVRPERIILVDDRLPYARDLDSTSEILYQRIKPEDLEATASRGLLEIADLILTKDSAPTREEAERRISSLGERPEGLEAVDRSLLALAPREGWVPSKKTWALYFAVVYAFAAFVALAVVPRRLPKFGLASLVGVAVLGMGGSAALFPRQQLWVLSDAVEELGAQTYRVWFLGSPVDLETSVSFPVLVKPIFASSGGTEEPFTLRVDDRGSRVEGLKLGPMRSACFGATLGPRSPKPGSVVAAPITAAILVRDGRPRFLGDLSGGAPIPESADGGDPAHRNPDYDAWSRLVGRNALFGRRAERGEPTRDLSSVDLADERERTRSLLQRLK